MVRACIFDLDGTLADTVESIAVAANRALSLVGLRALPVEDYKIYAGDGAKTLIERALKAAGDNGLLHFERAFEEYKLFFEKDCMYKVQVFDGILAMLEALKDRGVRCAVLSNKPHDRAVDVVNSLFAPGTFAHVQGQIDAIKHKPDPTGARMTLEVLGVCARECLYIGDTDVDMQTGIRAGIRPVGVLWGFRNRQELEENGAWQIIGNPSELLEFI